MLSACVFYEFESKNRHFNLSKVLLEQCKHGTTLGFKITHNNGRKIENESEVFS